MYRELASWFHLLTPPQEYDTEAVAALALLRATINGPLETLLDLGSGGGNMASHLKREVRVTLTDVSPEMVDVSRTINPDCEHIVGDMRTLRLGRTFDAVLAHDAICYMTTEADLRSAMATAFEHLRPGGAVLFEPDYVRETFKAGTDHGGTDGPGVASGRPDRGLRYLEWVADDDPADTTYETEYVIVRRDADGRIEVSHDHHIEGLFPQERWTTLMAEVGFVDAGAHTDDEDRIVFAGRRPSS